MKKAYRKQLGKMRHQAEVQSQTATPDPAKLSADPANLVHKFEVHQTEMELSNEEPVQKQGELQAALDKYQDLFNSTPRGCFVLDATDCIQDVNLTGCHLLGCEKRQLNSRVRFTRFINNEDCDEFYLRRKGATQAMVKHTCELRMKRMDGTPFYGQLSIIGTEKQAVMVTIEDVTERRELQKELAMVKEDLEARVSERNSQLDRSEKKYRELVENLNEIVYTVDRKGTITYISPVVEQVSGHKQSELTGRSFYDFIHKDDVPGMIEAFIKSLSGHPQTREYRFITREGEIRWGLASAKTILEKNNVTGLHGLIRDITNIKRSQEELVTSETNFRNSLDNSPLGIRIVTADGKTLYTNKAILDIYGYSSFEELADTPALMRYTPESYTEHQARKERRKLGLPGPDTYQISIIRKDGKVRHLAVLRREVSWAGQTQFQTIYQDITEQKLAGDELKFLSRRLIEIQEEERHAIARELHDEIGQTLSYLKLSIDRALSCQGKHIDYLRDSPAELDKLINQVRDLSSTLRPQMIYDFGLLEALRWHIDKYTTQTGVRVDFKYSGPKQDIGGELALTIFRVVQEALTNVVRHAQTSKVKLRIKASNEVIQLSVHDNGCGFDPVTVSGKTTGLGGMRERLGFFGGSLQIDSSPGAGTLLQIQIPFDKSL